MADLIRVIGIGPGNPDYVTPAAMELIQKSDVLVGGARVLSDFSSPGQETFAIKNNLAEMVEFIDSKRSSSTVAVIASGDPSFFGILEYLKRRFGADQLLVTPGISSVQLACARLAISWHDAVFHSVHGRGAEGLVDVVGTHPKVIILTDPEKTPARIAGSLIAAGITNRKMHVCENLSYSDERVAEFAISEVPEDMGKFGCVVVITEC